MSARPTVDDYCHCATAVRCPLTYVRGDRYADVWLDMVNESTGDSGPPDGPPKALGSGGGAGGGEGGDDAPPADPKGKSD